MDGWMNNSSLSFFFFVPETLGTTNKISQFSHGHEEMLESGSGLSRSQQAPLKRVETHPPIPIPASTIMTQIDFVPGYFSYMLKETQDHNADSWGFSRLPRYSGI